MGVFRKAIHQQIRFPLRSSSVVPDCKWRTGSVKWTVEKCISFLFIASSHIAAADLWP